MRKKDRERERAKGATHSILQSKVSCIGITTNSPEQRVDCSDLFRATSLFMGSQAHWQCPVITFGYFSHLNRRIVKTDINFSKRPQTRVRTIAQSIGVARKYTMTMQRSLSLVPLQFKLQYIMWLIVVYFIRYCIVRQWPYTKLTKICPLI